MELTIKVLHCDGDIIESETVMTFLADEKVSQRHEVVDSGRESLDKRGLGQPQVAYFCRQLDVVTAKKNQLHVV